MDAADTKPTACLTVAKRALPIFAALRWKHHHRRNPNLGVSRMFKRFIFEEDCQTLVEYGLLIGLLALVAVAAITLFGRRLSNDMYGTANNGLPFNN